MSHENKRLTGAELLKQQQEREAEARAANAAKEAEANKRHAEAEEAALRATVEKIKATWHDIATAAAKRDGVRFVVLAQVIDGHRLPAVAEIIASIAAGGFTGELAHPEPVDDHGRTAQRAVLANNAESYAKIGTVKGWMPANLPKLGSNGTIRFLIAKWG